MVEYTANFFLLHKISHRLDCCPKFSNKQAAAYIINAVVVQSVSALTLGRLISETDSYKSSAKFMSLPTKNK